MYNQLTLNVDPFLFRKVQIVAESKKLSLDKAVLFLLRKVITPRTARKSFRPKG